MTAGGSGSARFAATVNATLPAGLDAITSLGSIAADASAGEDLTPADNTAIATAALIAAPDLRLNIGDHPVVAVRGGSLAYTLTYSNAGMQDATGVVLTQALPAHTTFDAAASTAGWSETAPGVFTLAVGNVAAGAPAGNAIFAVKVAPVLPGGVPQIVASAVVIDDLANGPEPTPADNADNAATPLYQGIYVVAPGAVPRRPRPR